jgi:signal transduction histidine kinase
MDLQDQAKILVVDDVPEKRLAIEVMLEPLGQEVISVGSGADALRRLLHEDFALILLDVNMPGMDGFETAALIRQRRRSEFTPIIFLTAFGDDTHAARGYSLGAVDYILSPVMPEILRAKVAVFVELHRMTAKIQRQAQERVELARQQAALVVAERSNRSKSEFLTNVSHELRTPMNAIIGMTDLALDEDLSPRVREYLTTVKGSAKVLLELLNEILDYSKVQSGKFTLESTRFHLRELVAEVAQGLEVLARDKGLALSWQVSDDVPDALEGDALRLRQVLMNLLSNGIKFTERGEVRLQVVAQPALGKDARLRFSVSDSGIGISPEDQELIFAPFTQVDSSAARRQGGTGLGLAIASSLIRALGGNLAVESQPSRGSTFHFTIVLRQVGDDSQAERKPSSAASRPVETLTGPLDSAPARKLRVLVVEDTPANQMLVSLVLQRRGHEVRLASNGREAVEAARREAFDVILMDVQLPEMDGFQTTAAIRALPDRTRVPIVAVTAHARAEDRQRCLAADMDGYLAKPLDVRELIAMVESCAAAMAGAGAE